MRLRSLMLLVVSGAAAAVACTRQGSDRTAQVKLAVQVAALAGSQDACGNTLSSADLVLRRIELSGEQVEELSASPLRVDVAQSGFNGAIQQDVLSASLTVGTYGEAEFQIHPLELSDPADAAAAQADPGLAVMASAGISVKVAGVTSGGAPFTFTAGLSAEQQVATHVVVGASVTGIDSVTLTVDPSHWLGAPGACLDPNNPAVASQIQDNIRSSLSLEQDDDHDGDSDGSSGCSGSSDGGSGGGSCDGGSSNGGSGSPTPTATPCDSPSPSPTATP